MELTFAQKKKVYWKVFFLLAGLTIVEVLIVLSPLPHHLQTLLVVIASLSKAFFVGWIYMHLNHETRGLHIILLFPLFVAFFYATYLITDAPNRLANPYIGEPKRFFGQRNVGVREVDEFGTPLPVPAAITDPNLMITHHEGHEEAAEANGKVEARVESPEAGTTAPEAKAPPPPPGEVPPPEQK